MIALHVGRAVDKNPLVSVVAARLARHNIVRLQEQKLEKLRALCAQFSPRTFVPNSRQYITVNGVPCDHIPCYRNNMRYSKTEKWENGHMYCLMHIGPLNNPVETWIREDHFKVALA